MSDTRFAKEPANRRGNVFSHIVQPMAEQRHSVQAEVHARYCAPLSPPLPPPPHRPLSLVDVPCFSFAESDATPRRTRSW